MVKLAFYVFTAERSNHNLQALHLKILILFNKLI